MSRKIVINEADSIRKHEMIMIEKNYQKKLIKS